MKEIQIKQDSATTRMGYIPIGGGGLNAGYDTVEAVANISASASSWSSKLV